MTYIIIRLFDCVCADGFSSDVRLARQQLGC